MKRIIIDFHNFLVYQLMYQYYILHLKNVLSRAVNFKFSEFGIIMNFYINLDLQALTY